MDLSFYDFGVRFCTFMLIFTTENFIAKTPDSSRRDFLTGRAVKKEIRRAGYELADALDESGTERATPVAGETVRLETKAMGCSWFVIMNPGPPRQVMVASDAFDMVRDTEQMLTIYRDDSEVSLLNQEAASEWKNVSEELQGFLLSCQRLYDATGGAFDPAAGALINLWKLAREESRIPTQSEIEDALVISGMSLVHQEPANQRVKFEQDGLLLDFASIGKGYGIDQAAEHIRHEGIDSFLVHGGQSSLFAAGKHQGHDGWPIGLKNPLFTEKLYATILLKDVAMSTSGSNVQYFRYEGKRYGHLLDPRTGWPAEGLLSVTVIAPTATEADALSTAFYAMGLDNALQYCDDHSEIGAILIPAPTQGRVLEPVVKNFPSGRLFFES